VGSDKVKEGLKKAQELRRDWARAQREAAERQRQLQAIIEDQTRLRANLREVPQSSPLHRRYLGKLGRQEDDSRTGAVARAACWGGRAVSQQRHSPCDAAFLAQALRS
jgi:hypothetical protein